MRKSLPTVLALAIAIGATAAPVPALAQFGIFFGDERRDFYFGPMLCLDERQVRQAIAAEGYTDISLNVPYNRRIQVRATRDGWVYLIRFNYCNARIEAIERLRPAQQ